MTTSTVLSIPPLTGRPRPRTQHLPSGAVSSDGSRAVALGRAAGLEADEWQAWVLGWLLARRADLRWAAQRAGLLLSRQNGKGGTTELREMYGAVALGEKILHTAHRDKTSHDAFTRMEAWFDRAPELRRHLAKRNGIVRTNGRAAINTRNGGTIAFATRTRSGGLGLSFDVLVLDEAQEILDESIQALASTLSARSNPQIIYTGTAVDQLIHEHGLAFTRIRARGHAGTDPGLLWLEWAADGTIDDAERLFNDDDAVADANPSLGGRITPEFVQETERTVLSPRAFAVQRLGIGDWPALTSREGWEVISESTWTGLADAGSRIDGPVSLAIDVTPDRSRASIGAAGRRPDGLAHVEVVDDRPGADWVAVRAAELQARHHLAGPVVIDEAGPAASLVPALQTQGVAVRTIGTREYGQACGAFFDSASAAAVRHPGEPVLDAAVRGAVWRALGDARAWNRRLPTVALSPLVAVTLALWALDNQPVYSRAQW